MISSNYSSQNTKRTRKIKRNYYFWIKFFMKLLMKFRPYGATLLNFFTFFPTFKYLGTLLNFSLNEEKQIESIITKDNRALGVLKFLPPKNLPMLSFTYTLLSSLTLCCGDTRPGYKVRFILINCQCFITRKLKILKIMLWQVKKQMLKNSQMRIIFLAY